MKRALLILLLLGSLGFAQTAPMDLTVDQAIKLALANNPAYRISEQEVKQYRYRLMQNFGFLPEVTLQGSKILDEKLMTIEIPPLYPGGEPSKPPCASPRIMLSVSRSSSPYSPAAKYFSITRMPSWI